MSIFLLPLSMSAQAMGNATANYNNYGNNAPAQNNKKQNLAVQIGGNTTTLNAEILYNARPTGYLAIFAILQEGERLEQLDKDMNTRIETFKKGLQAIGIAESQIFSDFISLVPKYEMQIEKKKFSKTANEVPLGFQLKKNIHVSFTDGRMIDKIVSAAAAAEIYDLAKIEVNINDMKAVLSECRTKCTEMLKEKAKTMTDIGLKLYPLSIGENFETYYPTELYETYTACVTDFSQMNGNGIKTGKTSVKYADKNRTVFYNRVAYDQFDLVINPEFSEPPIQIHFKMSAYYSFENAELKIKREADQEKAVIQQEAIRKDEVEIRKIQAQNPPKTCCDHKQ